MTKATVTPCREKGANLGALIRQASHAEQSHAIDDEPVATLQLTPPDAPPPTQEQELICLAAEISVKLTGGTRAEILAGHLLYKAREIFKEEQSGNWLEQFEEFYSKLGLSQAKAYRLIRVIERWVDVINWQIDDPRIAELAAIGTCRLDEVRKLADNLWGFDDSGHLVVYRVASDGGDIIIGNLSFRQIAKLRDQLAPDTEVADGAGEGAAEHSPDNAANHDSDADHIDDHGSGDGTDGNATSTSVQNAPQPQRVNTISRGVIEHLAETRSSYWAFGEIERADNVQVVTGKIKGVCTGSETDIIVHGINVELQVSDGMVVAGVVDEGNDSFYSMTVGDRTKVYWYNHENPDAGFRSASITDAANRTEI
jgi:hypothetical protein